jgi:drug/metabolite transporter (DMT)-like permease
MAGIALVVLGTSRGNDARASLMGDLLVLVGSLTWAIYTVLLKPHTHHVPGIQLSAFTMLGGAASLLLVAWPAMARTSWRAVPASGFAALAYSGVFSLAIAYLFWYRGIRVIGPTRAAMYSNLQPVIAVLVAWPLLGEVPTAWQGVGAVCIMSGLVMTRA